MKTPVIVAAMLAVLAPNAILAEAGDIRAAYSEAYVMERYRAADSSGDGVLSRAEAGAATHYYEGAEGGRRFDVTDTDGDGFLSEAEVRARYQFEVAHGRAFAWGQKQVLYNAGRFEAADIDGDGYLSRAEANAAKVGRDLFAGYRFDAADKDGDGRLSFEEAAARVRLEVASY